MSQRTFNPSILEEYNYELYSYLRDLLKGEFEPFLQAPAEARSIRVNRLKCKKPLALVKSLHKKGYELRALSFTDNGYSIVEEPHPLSQTLHYFTGDIAFQGASSQVPAAVLNPKPGEMVLDMAAAPGSKTTQLGELMQNKGFVLANDSNRGRLQALNANMQRLGMLNGGISYLPGERMGRLYPQFFDKVLLDTPCSGLGTLGGHGEIAGWWSREKLNKLGKLQQHLFTSALKALKPGGELVYSTCSIAPEENERLMTRQLKEYPLELLSIDRSRFRFSSGMAEQEYTSKEQADKMLRLWPQHHEMEGFFVARLRKTDSYFSEPDRNKSEPEFRNTFSAGEQPLAGALDIISDVWGIEPGLWKNYRYLMTKSRIWMLPHALTRLPFEGVTNAGLLLAERRGQIWKLSHQSVQMLGTAVTERRLQLDDSQLRSLFATGRLQGLDLAPGYWVLHVADKPVAILFFDGSALRGRFPNAIILGQTEIY